MDLDDHRKAVVRLRLIRSVALREAKRLAKEQDKKLVEAVIAAAKRESSVSAESGDSADPSRETVYDLGAALTSPALLAKVAYQLRRRLADEESRRRLEKQDRHLIRTLERTFSAIARLIEEEHECNPDHPLLSDNRRESGRMHEALRSRPSAVAAIAARYRSMFWEEDGRKG